MSLHHGAAAASGGSGTTTNAATFDNSGAGAASGATFDGSAAKTISTNTIGALKASNNLSDVASVNTSAKNLQSGYVLAQSAVQSSHTGDTAEFTFATVTIPANAIGANGQVAIEALFGASGTNSKTPKVKFGGTVVTAGNAITTALNVGARVRISNRNAAGSQVFGPPTLGTSYSSSSAAVVTSAIDTTANVDVTFTGTLTSSGESISLESYQIIIYPKA